MTRVLQQCLKFHTKCFQITICRHSSPIWSISETKCIIRMLIALKLSRDFRITERHWYDMASAQCEMWHLLVCGCIHVRPNISSRGFTQFSTLITMIYWCTFPEHTHAKLQDWIFNEMHKYLTIIGKWRPQLLLCACLLYCRSCSTPKKCEFRKQHNFSVKKCSRSSKLDHNSGNFLWVVNMRVKQKKSIKKLCYNYFAKFDQNRPTKNLYFYLAQRRFNSSLHCLVFFVVS